MKLEGQINEVLKITFAVLVLPVLLTAAFSRIFMTKDVFAISYSFAVENPFGQELQNQLKLDCEKENCDFHDANFPNIHVFKNASQLISFSVSKKSLSELETLQSQLLSRFDVFLNGQSCLKDPVGFSADILVRKMTTQFIPQALSGDLAAVLDLDKVGKGQALKEHSKELCESLIKPLRRFFVSDIKATYEHELKKLKIVTVFYLIVAFFAFFGFYLYPRFKNRK